MMPETRARISTSREPSAWPTASSAIGTDWGATRITVTGMGGGGPTFALASPPLPQPASRMAETTKAATAAGEMRRFMGLLAGKAATCGRECRLLYIPKRMYVCTGEGAMRRTKEDAAKTREAIVTAALAC